MAGGEIETIAYLRERFREHYLTHAEMVEVPPSFDQREFGFLSFEGKTMFRHIAFRSPEEMRNYLKTNAPAHVYYSSAYYEAPEAEMERKGWLGADLVFDIDADHIETPCKNDHDRWTCRNCGMEGKGSAPESCPNCGRANFKEENWLCEKCLEAAKFETLKLLDILVQDLGFSPRQDLDVNFSGHRGYHVHVYQEEARQLDQLARRELVDYIMGTGIEARFHGFAPVPRGEGPAMAGIGWGGRLARALYDFILDAEPKPLEGLGLSGRFVKNLLERREEILESLIKEPPGRMLRFFGPRDRRYLDRLVEVAVRREASAIDTVVTTDIHRLIRLPMTLHGKTGLRAEEIPVDGLEGFDPLRSAIAFDEGEITVQVMNAPEFRVGGETFGPFRGEKVELPAAAAILLLCKRVASVII